MPIRLSSPFTMQIRPPDGTGVSPYLHATDLDRLLEFDTCTLANAIETFNIRLRNEGYMGPGCRCLYKDLPPVSAMR